MLEPATMRHCNNGILAIFFAGAALALVAQPAPTPKPAQASQTSQPQQSPSLTVDRDPVRSPDPEVVAPATGAGNVEKEGSGYILHTDVEEVVLNATVLEGTRLVPDLKADNFRFSKTV